MARVYIIGTCDTKYDELAFAKERATAAGADAVLVDVGTTSFSGHADVAAEQVARHHPSGVAAVLGQRDRGVAVQAMADALTAYLATRTDIGAVLGLGGSGNTALVTQAMRALPVGIPKLMVSTVASGNVAPYIGPNDIGMVYSVVDIAGLNAISRRVIGNAAHAVAGMALNKVPARRTDKPGRLGLTMFGVTTPCVTHLRTELESDYDIYVFHATGTGGQSMEKLVDSGMLTGVLDVTTTEVADFLCGGTLPCTRERFSAFIRTRTPYVGSVGAVDMVNFGARNTVPTRYGRRNLHSHNSEVTLMRTTADENRAIGLWIVDRLNRMDGPVRFLLPLRGVSMIDAPEQPFYDPAADAALFEAIREGWCSAPHRELIEIDAHINDPVFAAAMADSFRGIAR